MSCGYCYRLLDLMHAEAPALEEVLRDAGFAVSMMQNPAFDTDPIGSPSANQEPALSALQSHVTSRRSSLAVISKAGRHVRQSVFASARKAAGLTVGMVS